MTTPETLRVLLASNAMTQGLDLPQRTKHLCSRANEIFFKQAQEPSLAGFRVQEHVHKTVPVLAKDLPTIAETTKQLNGVMFDLEYTSDFLDKLDDSIQNSVSARETISELASKISAATSRNAR